MAFLAQVGTLVRTGLDKFFLIGAAISGFLVVYALPASAQVSTQAGGWVMQQIPLFNPPECQVGAPVTPSCTARDGASLAAAEYGFEVEITNPNSNISLNWTYLNGDNNALFQQENQSVCSQDVSINFAYSDQYGNPTGSGTCILSQGQALVESSQATLPNCDPSNPSSWSSGCVVPPVCPSAGTDSSYYCGTNSKSPQVCGCTQPTSGSGTSSACTGTADGNGNYVGNSYYCGSNATCACSPQGTPGATAAYCGIGQSNTAQTPCIPQPNYYSLNPVQLNTPYTVAIQQELVNIVNNNDRDGNFAAIVNNIGQLSNQTNGCRNDNGPLPGQ